MKGTLIFCAALLLSEIAFAQDAMIIDEQGNVGINNDNPTEQLEINGNLKVNGNIYAQTVQSEERFFVYIVDGAANTVTHALPDAAARVAPLEIWWECENGGEVLFTTEAGQTIDGDDPAIWKGAGSGYIRLIPVGGSYRVADYRDAGTGVNGSWVKYADKVMECWQSEIAIELGSVGDSAVGVFGWSFHYGVKSIVFPFSFTSPPSVTASVQSGAATIQLLTSTGFDIVPYCYRGDDEKASYHAKGLWAAQ